MKELETARISELHRQRIMEQVIISAIDELRSSCRELEGHIKSVFLKARKDYDPSDWEYRASMPEDIHKLCEAHHLKVSAQLGKLQQLFARSYQGIKPSEIPIYESQTAFSMREQPPVRKARNIRAVINEVSNLLD